MLGTRRKVVINGDVEALLLKSGVEYGSGRSSVLANLLLRYDAMVAEGRAAVTGKLQRRDINEICTVFIEDDLGDLLTFTSKEDIPGFIKLLKLRSLEHGRFVEAKIIRQIESRLNTVEFVGLVQLVVQHINESNPFFNRTQLHFFSIALSDLVGVAEFDRLYESGPQKFIKKIVSSCEKKRMPPRWCGLNKVRMLTRDSNEYKSMLDEVKTQLFGRHQATA